VDRDERQLENQFNHNAEAQSDDTLQACPPTAPQARVHAHAFTHTNTRTHAHTKAQQYEWGAHVRHISDAAARAYEVDERDGAGAHGIVRKHQEKRGRQECGQQGRVEARGGGAVVDPLRDERRVDPDQRELHHLGLCVSARAHAMRGPRHVPPAERGPSAAPRTSCPLVPSTHKAKAIHTRQRQGYTHPPTHPPTHTHTHRHAVTAALACLLPLRVGPTERVRMCHVA
jgi:hypothetical protein